MLEISGPNHTKLQKDTGNHQCLTCLRFATNCYKL